MSETSQPKGKRRVSATPPLPEPTAARELAAIPVAAEVAVVALPVVAPPRPLLQPTPRAAEELLGGYRSAVAAMGESQRAVASGIKALALEMTGFAQSHLIAAGDSATAIIGARSLADAVETQFGFARRSLEGAFAASTRMSEIAVRLVSEAARPIVAPLAAAPRRG
jgi:hypothetical protein